MSENYTCCLECTGFKYDSLVGTPIKYVTNFKDYIIVNSTL